MKALPTKAIPAITAKPQLQVRALADFQTFGDANLEASKREAKKFCEAVRVNPDGAGYCLSFVGRSGNGKTMLAHCILAELGLNTWGSLSAIPVSLSGNEINRHCAIMRDWRKVSDNFKQGQYAIAERLESEFLAVIDDIGADHDPSRASTAKLDSILRARKNRWTIVTSNFALSEIQSKIDERISSWLIRDKNRVVEMTAIDYALR